MPCGNDFFTLVMWYQFHRKKIWRNKKNIKPPLVPCCWYNFFWQRWQMIKKKHFTTVRNWDARIFQKFWSHLKILRTIRVISTTFQTEGPQIPSGTISQLWRAGLHEFSKNFEAISKFYAPYRSYQPRSKLRAHKYQGELFHNCDKLGCTNFPKILKPSQNSRHHTGHINHLRNWGPTNTEGGYGITGIRPRFVHPLLKWDKQKKCNEQY